jgi:hypothetical protein
LRTLQGGIGQSYYIQYHFKSSYHSIFVFKHILSESVSLIFCIPHFLLLYLCKVNLWDFAIIFHVIVLSHKLDLKIKCPDNKIKWALLSYKSLPYPYGIVCQIDKWFERELTEMAQLERVCSDSPSPEC